MEESRLVLIGHLKLNRRSQLRDLTSLGLVIEGVRKKTILLLHMILTKEPISSKLQL